MEDLAIGQGLSDPREILLQYLLGPEPAQNGCEPNHSRKGGDRQPQRHKRLHRCNPASGVSRAEVSCMTLAFAAMARRLLVE